MSSPSSFIQINIYNKSLKDLEARGIDLETILSSIDCRDVWISDVPILPPSDRPAESPRKNHPLSLKENPRKKSPETMKDLFEDWDPILNLPASSAPHPAQPPPKIAKTTPALPPIAQAHAPEDPSISGLLSPKEDPSITGILLPKEEPVEDETLEYSVLDEPIDEREMKLINDLFRSKKSLSGLDETQQPTMRIPRKFMGEDDMSNTVYTISCEFPNCYHQYNWRVKYGKLRLLDHALTHSSRQIPCKICGFEATNVRRMRSHYAKDHPKERVMGYGMKALVSGDDEVGEEEMKELWKKCYSSWIGLVGEACGFKLDFNTKYTRRKRNADE